jgi:PadR family transcriptional regulator, regulatory protein PadR
MPLRRTPQTTRVLGELFYAPREWRHGYDISRTSGLKSGTLYPILIRLTENGLLETKWELSEMGKPPRHMYRLTQAGIRIAREYVSTAQMISMKTSAAGA